MGLDDHFEVTSLKQPLQSSLFEVTLNGLDLLDVLRDPEIKLSHCF